MARKLALIIGNSDYQDPLLARLITPAEDAQDLADVLRAPEIGGFDEVVTLLNQPAPVIRRAVSLFFNNKHTDDLVLLYFSGHGVRDDSGLLYLAVQDTEHDLLDATAIPAAFVTDGMNRSRSQRQVLILDCCHSGAFAHGAKGIPGLSVGTAAAFEGTGYGRIVLTATDATQYAWQGDQLMGQAEHSIFTHFLVEGLRSGAADLDGDGRVTLDEWYEFASEQVARVTPKQTPGRWSYKLRGKALEIARNPSSPLDPARLGAELDDAIRDRRPWVREGAVHELQRLLKSSQPDEARAAREALQRLVERDDSATVKAAAAAALNADTEAPAVSQTMPAPAIEPAKADRLAQETQPVDVARVRQQADARPSVKQTTPPIKSNRRSFAIIASVMGAGLICLCALVFGQRLFAAVFSMLQPGRPTATDVAEAALSPSPPAASTSTRIPATATRRSATLPPATVEATTSGPLGGGSGRIAFYSYRDGAWGIYTVNTDGTGETLLTTANGSANESLSLSWSPDGARIVFGLNAGPGPGLYTLSADGSGLARIADTGTFLPGGISWSAPGAWIAYSRYVAGANTEIYKITDKGFGETRLTQNAGHDDSPTWSPDGARIAFSSEEQPGGVYIMNYDGSDLKLLVSPGNNPAWSPDGTQIIFECGGGICAANPDGPSVTQNLSLQCRYPSWSPDSKKIAVTCDDEIYIANADGTSLTRLTNNAFKEQSPVWQP